jgi:hypothetical protein
MAAKRLGWREHVVREAVGKGEIASVTISGLPRITNAEIERLEGIFGPLKSDTVSDLPAEPVMPPAPQPAVGAELLERLLAVIAGAEKRDVEAAHRQLRQLLGPQAEAAE